MLITIDAIDRHSSDTMGRTFTFKDKESFKKSVEEWENNEIPFSRYELMTQEFIEDNDLESVLDELDVTY